MYDFDRERYPKTHMPFAVHDGDRLREFGCVMVNGLWKVHELVDGEWIRIDTGLPEDATECSPYAWWDAVENKLTMTFIGGASAFSLPFRLYSGEAGNFHEVVRASVGFCWKGIVAHGDGSNEFDVETDGLRRHITMKGVSYIYRLSLDETNPTRILASCKMDNDDIRTFAISLQYGICDELIADGHSTYKPCLCEGHCAYAVKNGEDFEDRTIVVTDDWRLEHVDDLVEIADEPIVEED